MKDIYDLGGVQLRCTPETTPEGRFRPRLVVVDQRGATPAEHAVLIEDDDEYETADDAIKVAYNEGLMWIDGQL